MADGTSASQWPPQINAFYTEDTTQLRFMKRQQWGITNYLIALLAGIFWAHDHIAKSFGWWEDAAPVLIWVAASIGALLLYRIQCDMNKPRSRLRWITETYVDTDDPRAIGTFADRKGFWYSWLFLAALFLVIFGAAVIATLAVWASPICA